MRPGGGPMPPGVPPHPGGPYPGAPYGPPRRGGSGGRKLLGCLFVGVVMVLLVGVGGYVVYLQRTSHTLSTPLSAGGLTRDTDAEANAKETISRLNTVLSEATDYDVQQRVSAIYGTGEEKYLFVGGTGEHDLKYPVQDFNGAVSTAFSGIEKTIYSPSTVKISDAGGDGVALSTVLQIQIIGPTGRTTYSTGQLAAWSTRTTMGIVMRAGRPSESIDLATVMRNIRKDVED
ncbi:hypothetical protein BZB76_2680 [Actinomadura pelletieri DSM 43383]|uniref:Mce-associated membrane protein n=1 Tax=Actinomadura pelletieri DSM 43383 TaxID=1120940 RepID=A0A495QUV7_9ACTN|nr:hypothetical protein [Actinomadura pelletieri]RKS77299.1 hypothetical protein BZB76_2680 [Actinomadura pelletieri DSM 43383]